MAITTKRPKIKETVGALYYAFNVMKVTGEFDPENYEETVKSDVVKTINTTDNTESTVVRASGADYMTAYQTSSADNEVEVVAIDPEDLYKMKGEDIHENGLVLGGAPKARPYFAFGKLVKKIGGAVEYVWYPKCQLVENTDEAATSEEEFSEQNDTITIKAYAFDDEGHISVRVNSEMSNFPEGLTEEKFFEKPILNDTGLTNAITPAA